MVCERVCCMCMLWRAVEGWWCLMLSVDCYRLEHGEGNKMPRISLHGLKYGARFDAEHRPWGS